MFSNTQTVQDVFRLACETWPHKMFLSVSQMARERSGQSSPDRTFEQTSQAVSCLVAQLRQSGYGYGHRVGLMLGNDPEHFIWLLALNAIGASAVPLQMEATVENLAFVVRHSEIELILAAEHMVADLEEVVRSYELEARIIQTDQPIPPCASHSDAQQAPSRLGSEACVLYTSGTTGKPKGCLISNAYFKQIGQYYAEAGGVAHLRPGRERIFTPLPVFHQNAGIFTFMGAMMTGNCMVMTDRFHASTWWEEVEKTGATVIHYLGVMPAILLQRPDPALNQLSGLRFGIGAGVEPGLHVEFERRYGIPLVELWGMTETGGGFIASHEPRLIDTRAFGRPGQRSGVDLEVRLVDFDGNNVPPGEKGELLVRRLGSDPRAGMFSGYLKDFEATEEAWDGGWFHTGDVVRQDESGMLSFVERRKNIIRRAGENIAAAEVEHVLLNHPDVAQAAVLAVPDPIREEEVMAVIVMREKTVASAQLAKDIFALCAKELAYFKTPGWVLFRSSLPTTATQKVQKQQIFGEGENPLDQPGLLDLRGLKKPNKQEGKNHAKRI